MYKYFFDYIRKIIKNVIKVFVFKKTLNTISILLSSILFFILMQQYFENNFSYYQISSQYSVFLGLSLMKNEFLILIVSIGTSIFVLSHKSFIQTKVKIKFLPIPDSVVFNGFLMLYFLIIACLVLIFAYLLFSAMHALRYYLASVSFILLLISNFCLLSNLILKINLKLLGQYASLILVFIESSIIFGGYYSFLLGIYQKNRPEGVLWLLALSFCVIILLFSRAFSVIKYELRKNDPLVHFSSRVSVKIHNIYFRILLLELIRNFNKYLKFTLLPCVILFLISWGFNVNLQGSLVAILPVIPVGLGLYFSYEETWKRLPFKKHILFFLKYMVSMLLAILQYLVLFICLKWQFEGDSIVKILLLGTILYEIAYLIKIEFYVEDEENIFFYIYAFSVPMLLDLLFYWTSDLITVFFNKGLSMNGLIFVVSLILAFLIYMEAGSIKIKSH